MMNQANQQSTKPNTDQEKFNKELLVPRVSYNLYFMYRHPKWDLNLSRPTMRGLPGKPDIGVFNK